MRRSRIRGLLGIVSWQILVFHFLLVGSFCFLLVVGCFNVYI